MSDASKFQILSIDGGGIRGIFSAALLAAIEEDEDVRITDHFDLIAGTSTGGIIAIALGLGMRPKDILQFYLDHGPTIFANPLRARSIQHWVRRKYSGEELKASIRATFGEKLFGASTKRLVVPAFNIGENAVYVFRTPHIESLKRDYRVPAWKVAMATAAAPTYFPAFKELDGLRLVDGGVWANNPAMVAIAEAIGPLGVSLDSVSLLSIGSITALRRYPGRLDWGGLVIWARRASELIVDASGIGVSNQAAFLLTEARHLRISPMGHENDVNLDSTRESSQLVARARHHSRHHMPAINERFLAHLAPSYEPCHR